MENKIQELKREIEFREQQSQEMLNALSTSHDKDLEEVYTQARAVCDERDEALDQQKQLQVQIEEKDSKIHQLQNEILHYKKSISGASHVEGQLTDTTIQKAMDGLFYAVRDWALQVARQEKTSKCLSCDVSSIPPTYTTATSVFDSISKETAEWLHCQVPGGKKESSTRIVNGLIAAFADTLCESMKMGWIFGVGFSDGSQRTQLTEANSLHRSIQSKFELSALLS